MSDNTIIAFDLYGTLLSTSSIAAKLAKHFGKDVADTVAAKWRLYQLEYTWRLNSMQLYEPFSSLTRRSLLQALAENKLHLDEPDIEQLMQAYDDLDIFEDVGPALEALKAERGITAVVFSNGTREMVQNSVNGSRGLAAHKDVFADLVVVEEVEKFKPDPDVYRHLAKKMGKGTDEKSMSSMWLVSGNPFDVTGARAVGMQAAWVDRTGNGWTDELREGPEGRPTVIVKGLGEVVEAVSKHARSS